MSATQLEAGRAGVITPEMEIVAEAEKLTPEVVREEVAPGDLRSVPASQRAYPRHRAMHRATPAFFAKRLAVASAVASSGGHVPCCCPA